MLHIPFYISLNLSLKKGDKSPQRLEDVRQTDFTGFLCVTILGRFGSVNSFVSHDNVPYLGVKRKGGI